MNTTVNFHGFVDLYQEESAQQPGGKTAAGISHYTPPHRPGIFIDATPEGEPQAESGKNYSGD